tara:strand:- start:340 stop:768 length:429 start_codon:yes stop_codon:yes gene_type:complete
MTIEELNKIIQEELKAYLNEEQTDGAYMEDGDEDAPEADGDDDIEVTTDEPAEKEDDALDTLRQIYNMLKPMVEPEDEEPEMDMGDEESADEEGEEEEMDEAVGYPNHRADQISKVKMDADDVNRGLNESVERFKKLANIKG